MPSSTQRNTRLGACLALSLTLRLHAFHVSSLCGLALFEFYTTMSMCSKSMRSAPPRKIRAVRRTSIIYNNNDDDNIYMENRRCIVHVGLRCARPNYSTWNLWEYTSPLNCYYSHTHTHTCAYTHTHTHKHTCTHTYTHVHTRTHNIHTQWSLV